MTLITFSRQFLGYTDMALEELPEESNLRFDIEQINNAANRGKDLVQQILTFSREVDFEEETYPDTTNCCRGSKSA